MLTAVTYISLFEFVTEVNIVTLAKHRLRADDGLCKPKHVGATIIILNDFNCLTIL